MESDIKTIVARLRVLREYSSELSRRMEHEVELADDAVPFLVERLESAYSRCLTATTENKLEAFHELAVWRMRSYKFYILRLARVGNAWAFTFDGTEGQADS